MMSSGGKPTLVHQDVVAAFADLGLALVGVGLACLVERHHHGRRAVAAHQRGVLDEVLLAFLQRDGIDDGLALHALQAGLDDAPLGGVDHQRHFGDIRLGGDQVEELHHRGFAVQHGLVHVDVDHLRAGLHLLLGDFERLVVFAFEDQALELGRAGDVGALADVDEQRVVADVERLQAGQAAALFQVRQLARRHVFQRFGDGLDVRRRSAAAAARDVEEAAGGELLHQARGLLRQFVVAGFGQWIGQAGVGVGAHVAARHARHFFHVRPHQLRAQRAVEADGQRLGVAQGIPERLGGLAGQRTAGSVGDRAGDHDRHAHLVLLEMALDGEQCGLGVQCVEDGLDHQDIRAAIQQAAHGLGVAFHQLVEGNVTRAGIVHVRRDGGCFSGRAEHARNEARLVFGRKLIAQPARQFGSGHVQFVHQMHQIVVLHRHRRGVEGAGLEDVRARFQVLAMDAADDVRLGQQQQVVAALHVHMVVREVATLAGVVAVQLGTAVVRLGQFVALDHGAHGAVEDQDAFLQEVFDRMRGMAHSARLKK